MKLKKCRRRIALLLCVWLTAAFCACSSGTSSKTQASQTKQEYTLSPAHKVIIDTDTGADDASALILAAKAPNIEILGVTTLAGNVDLEQSTKNTLAALELAGCDAPVYRGSAENYSGEKIDAYSVFGTDGMGDADLVHPNGKAEESDAVDFIINTVKADPNEVEIVALGPATNIAKAIERDPDAMKKVKRIWSMGTTGYGHGNATPVAEFNVYNDPYAYRVMLDSGIDITVIGLDMCAGDAEWTEAQFEELESADAIGHFVSTSFKKLRDFYAKNNSGGSTKNCDSLAMMCLIYQEFITGTDSCHGSCITDKSEAHGQVIFYQEGFTYDVADNDFTYNVTRVSGVRGKDYFPLYLRTVGASE